MQLYNVNKRATKAQLKADFQRIIDVYGTNGSWLDHCSYQLPDGSEVNAIGGHIFEELLMEQL